ncbi:MAG: hypothetical protein J6A45_02505, partial [Lachnospiraceae bacterium]|nr:hypothetical protein [Lachnospiraceae bacterium]
VSYSGLTDSPSFGYTYDALGNILTYTENGVTYTYSYDDQSQLLSAVGNGKTYTYSYDNAGNILAVSDGTASHTYTYGNSVWKDLLTAYDGRTITYDASGNPLSYYNGTPWSFTWTEGRKLDTASGNGHTIAYVYDPNGLRTSKTVDNTQYSYVYNDGELLRQTGDGKTLDFIYDHDGAPYALIYSNGSAAAETYYYITNLQGDVMQLVDEDGNTAAQYSYDPYGNILSATGDMAEVNPLRYRGYYYDSESGLYYLQSRYYDPAVGRFINADAFISTGYDILGFNAFSYCYNSPCNSADQTGMLPKKVLKLINCISIEALFYSYMSGLYSSLSSSLVKVGAYVTHILLPKVTSLFWYQPWIVVGVVASAVAVVIASLVTYRNIQVANINNANMDKTVEEILKSKKASIKNAPLPPGGPDWKDIMKKTLREIKELAQKNVKGYKEIYKLLTDGRFNIGRK